MKVFALLFVIIGCNQAMAIEKLEWNSFSCDVAKRAELIPHKKVIANQTKIDVEYKSGDIVEFDIDTIISGKSVSHIIGYNVDGDRIHFILRENSRSTLTINSRGVSYWNCQSH